MWKWYAVVVVTALVTGCSPDNGKDGVNGMNGANGANGNDGASAHVESVALCPSIPAVSGGFSEYLIRVESELFGVYAHGSNIGLTKIGPGHWTTTDGRGCNFVVNTDLSVVY